MMKVMDFQIPEPHQSLIFVEINSAFRQIQLNQPIRPFVRNKAIKLHIGIKNVNGE